MGPYQDGGYDLPPLDIRQHLVAVDLVKDRGDGQLFRQPEMSATSIHAERRRTVGDRSRFAKELVSRSPDEPWIVWVETNYDQDAIEAMIPGAISVRGSDTPERKARELLRFSDEGGVIITKPKIAGMGLNWQHCAHQVFMGGSFSYEGFYQAVRRSWRFGQTRPVVAHVVMAATEQAIWRTIHRKAKQHEEMKKRMYAASAAASDRESQHIAYSAGHIARVPAWLHTLRSAS
jgi:hypothetical protein